MKQLKLVSDALLVLAVVFAVVALVGPSWTWYLAAFCLLVAVMATVLKRRAAKAKKTAA